MLVNECCQFLVRFVSTHFYKKVKLMCYRSCVYYITNKHVPRLCVFVSCTLYSNMTWAAPKFSTLWMYEGGNNHPLSDGLKSLVRLVQRWPLLVDCMSYVSDNSVGLRLCCMSFSYRSEWLPSVDSQFSSNPSAFSGVILRLRSCRLRLWLQSGWSAILQRDVVQGQ